MRWTGMQKQKETSFNRLTGESRTTFEKMASYVSERRERGAHCKGGGKRGRKPKLIAEDEVLMLLMYYREYRIFAHIGMSYELGEV